MLLLTVSIVLLISACGSDDTPTLTDAGRIWCDESRWRVVVRAQQLGLVTPASNPAQEIRSLEQQERTNRLQAQRELGDISRGEHLAQLERLVEEAETALAKYSSGEWHTSGVLDSDWADYIEEEPGDYRRACNAAFELRD